MTLPRACRRTRVTVVVLLGVLLLSRLFVSPRRAVQTIPTARISSKPTKQAASLSTEDDESSLAAATTTATTSNNNKNLTLPTIQVDNGFHYCRLRKLQDPRYNWRSNHVMEIWYQCQGDAYTRFAHQLRSYVKQRQKTSTSTTTTDDTNKWGRRDTAMPANTTVLVLGNSHLRQVALAWACQYAAQITELQRFDTQQADPFMVTRIAFQNGAVLLIVINSYVVYSPKWKQLLEQQINARLSDMDAIVLGVFNGCVGATQTSFYRNTINMTSNLSHVDCHRYPGPTVANVLQVYHTNKGRLLFVTPFSVSHLRAAMQARRDVQRTTTTTTTSAGGGRASFLKGRQHVDAMGHAECAAHHRWGVNDAVNTSCVSNTAQAWTWHRCTGEAGGHADLVAWDVQAWLFATRDLRM